MFTKIRIFPLNAVSVGHLSSATGRMGRRGVQSTAPNAVKSRHSAKTRLIAGDEQAPVGYLVGTATANP